MNIAEKILRAKDDYDAVYEAGKKAVVEVLKFIDVSSNSYRSTVPNGVEPFAKVNKIGGMTYKSKNLIPFPYYRNQTDTMNGITYTVNEDGTIVVNGDSTAGSYYFLQNDLRLPEGVTMTLSGCPSGGGTRKYCLYINVFVDGEWKNEWYDTGNGVTFETVKNGVYTVSVYGAWAAESMTHENRVFKPMLNEGSTRLPYEPYFEGLRSAKVDELKSEGSNLIPFPYYHASGRTDKGITYTYGENGIVTLDGLSTGYSEILLFANKQLKAGTYVLRAFGTDRSIVSVLQMYKNSSWVRNVATDEGNGKTVTITEEEANNYVFTLNIYVAKVNINLTDRQIKPMLVYGSTIPSEYKSYVGTLDTLAIPKVVKSIEGYGQGNPDDNSEYNYIDFNRKVFVSFGHLTDEGWVRYETPIETDISAYLTDEYIEVEGGGTITAVNEYGYDAPTNISYIVDTQGG